ncbi:hypothetical protein BDN71DRAFT_1442923 [Pleurotus eryngii]|uniref:Uncharacterized protein n=1 Tax=Pleurotus eryngii TaxID=5323 RepID=A0A9P6A3H0_PLEER|nr:hypothetical protein BDN71DRAFT_1442923 [Pleurotus eryngii]
MEPTQLINQAETISALIAQRDKLIEEAEYSMARLESEREEWLRTAEALVAANSGHGRSKGVRRDDSDLERQCAAYESDNKSLREKLAATQLRLTSLETELAKLRPLLLMQQSKVDERQSSITVPTTIYGTSAYLTTGLIRSRLAPDLTLVPKGKGKEREVLPSVPEDSDIRSAPMKKPPSNATKHPKQPGTLFSDARSEHILLAARRLGRIRTNALSEMAMNNERDRRESTSTLQTHRLDDTTSESHAVYTSPGVLPQTPKGKGRRQSVAMASPHALTPAAFSASMTPTRVSPYGPWYGYGFYAPGVYGIGLGVPASPTNARTAGRSPAGEPATTTNRSHSTVGNEPPATNERANEEGSSVTERASEDAGGRKDNADGSETPLASLLSAARMMDTAPGADGAAGDEGREEVSSNTRPQRAGRGQKEKSTKPTTSRRCSDAASTKGTDEQTLSQPPKKEKVQRGVTTRAGRSRKVNTKKRQAVQVQGERPTKRRRVSDQARSTRGHSRSPRQRDAEGENDSLHSASVSNASTNGARLIASPQNVTVRDGGADPGDNGSSSRPIERVRSALDVLADQASAAASEAMTQRRSSTSRSSSPRATGLESVVDGESVTSPCRPAENWVQRDDIDDDGGADNEGPSVRPVRAQRVRALTAKERDRQEREAMKKPRGRSRRSLPSGEMTESNSNRVGKVSRRTRTSNVAQRDLSSSKAGSAELTAPIPGARMISPPNHVGLLSATPCNLSVSTEVEVEVDVASTSIRGETESATEGQIVVISPTQASTASSADEIVRTEVEAGESHAGPSITADASITEGGSNALSQTLGIGAAPGAETNEIETSSIAEEDDVPLHQEVGADGTSSPLVIGESESLQPPKSSVGPVDPAGPPTIVVDIEQPLVQDLPLIELSTNERRLELEKHADEGEDVEDEDAEGEPEGDQDSFYDPVPMPETGP